MSADNYLLVGRDGDAYSVWHLFASDDEVDVSTLRPKFTATERDRALEWAHRWASEHVCEYGVVVDNDVWEARDA